MRKIIFILICFLVIPKTKAEDSQLKYSASFGSNSFLFNKGIIDPDMNFIAYGVNPLKNFIIGGKVEKKVNLKNFISIGLFYSNSSLQYLYNDRMGWSIGPGGIINHKGYIHYSQIVFNNLGKYSVFKWLNLEYGLNHNLNLKNTFDNKEIGKYTGWTDTSGKSKMKTYSFGYSLGIEFKLSPKIGFEILHNRGLNNCIVLYSHIPTNPSVTRTPQKLIHTSFTLNYTF